MCSPRHQIARATRDVEKMLEDRVPGSSQSVGAEDEEPAEERGPEAPHRPAESGRPWLPDEAAGACGPPALLQVLDRLFHDVPLDPPLLLGIADEQAVIAHDVDKPWDPAGVLRDP